MISLFKNRPNRGTVCARCQFIRLFIIAALAVVIFAFTAGDRVEYLQLVTPARAAAAIWISGGILFIIKFIGWRLEKRNAINADHE